MGKSKQSLLALKRKTLRGLKKCNEIVSDLNRECCELGAIGQEFRGWTCYYCELLDTTIENLAREIREEGSR